MMISDCCYRRTVNTGVAVAVDAGGAGPLAQCLRDSASRARLKQCSFDFAPGSDTASSTRPPHSGRPNGRPKTVEPQENRSPQRNLTRGSPKESSLCRSASRSHHTASRSHRLQPRPRKRPASDSLTRFRGAAQQTGEIRHPVRRTTPSRFSQQRPFASRAPAIRSRSASLSSISWRSACWSAYPSNSSSRSSHFTTRHPRSSTRLDCVIPALARFQVSGPISAAVPEQLQPRPLSGARSSCRTAHPRSPVRP